MPPLTRRAFTRAATAAATIPFLPGRNPAARWFATRGPNPDGILRVAVAGIRSRGSSHISGFQSLPGVDVVALVDVDSKVLAQRKAELEKNKLAKNGWEGGEVQGYADLRDALAREDLADEERLSSAFERLATHLDKNGIDLAQQPAVLGAALDFDPVRERFLNSDAANRLRTRAYRAPFIVPEEI